MAWQNHLQLFGPLTIKDVGNKNDCVALGRARSALATAVHCPLMWNLLQQNVKTYWNKEQKPLTGLHSWFCSDSSESPTAGLPMSVLPKKSTGDFAILILQTTRKSNPLHFLTIQFFNLNYSLFCKENMGSRALPPLGGSHIRDAFLSLICIQIS